jgi:hypothetical protein
MPTSPLAAAARAVVTATALTQPWKAAEEQAHPPTTMARRT